MTPEQKLHRAITEIIYQRFEAATEEYHHSEGHEGDYEDVLIEAVNECVKKAKEYQKVKSKM